MNPYLMGRRSFSGYGTERLRSKRRRDRARRIVGSSDDDLRRGDAHGVTSHLSPIQLADLTSYLQSL
jgi:hypothetical protein